MDIRLYLCTRRYGWGRRSSRVLAANLQTDTTLSRPLREIAFHASLWHMRRHLDVASFGWTGVPQVVGVKLEDRSVQAAGPIAGWTHGAREILRHEALALWEEGASSDGGLVGI